MRFVSYLLVPSSNLCVGAKRMGASLNCWKMLPASKQLKWENKRKQLKLTSSYFHRQLIIDQYFCPATISTSFEYSSWSRLRDQQGFYRHLIGYPKNYLHLYHILFHQTVDLCKSILLMELIIRLPKVEVAEPNDDISRLDRWLRRLGYFVEAE